MKAETQTTLDPLFELLQADCTTSLHPDNSPLQKAILKKYFRASRVAIKSTEKELKIKIFPLLSGTKSTAYHIKIPKVKMAAFLQSCINNDTQGKAFYKNMMRYFLINGLNYSDAHSTTPLKRLRF